MYCIDVAGVTLYDTQQKNTVAVACGMQLHDEIDVHPAIALGPCTSDTCHGCHCSDQAYGQSYTVCCQRLTCVTFMTLTAALTVNHACFVLAAPQHTFDCQTSAFCQPGTFGSPASLQCILLKVECQLGLPPEYSLCGTSCVPLCSLLRLLYAVPLAGTVFL